jgi:hypothetical protein
LDGVGEFDVEIIEVRTNKDNNTTYIVGDFVGAVAVNIENAFPHGPIRMGPEKALAEGDKYGDVKDRIWGQLVQVQPINKEQSTKEFVNRRGKTADQVVNEGYPVLDGWRQEAFFTGKDQTLLLLH